MSNPGPKDHLVYPCFRDSQLVEAVCLFAGAGLLRDEGVVLIMTDSHRRATTTALRTEGFCIEDEERRGHLTFVSAENLLQRFLKDGLPDATLFKNLVAILIERTRLAATGRRVRLFGEMVSLMFGSNDAAALRLEELWNEVIESYSVPLLCAYSLRVSHLELPQSILDCHTRSV